MSNVIFISPHTQAKIQTPAPPPTALQSSLLEVVKLDPRATLPTVATVGEDLGYDLYALEDAYVIAGRIAKVRTGIAATAWTYSIRQHWEDAWNKTHDADNQVVISKPELRCGLRFGDRSSMAERGFLTLGGVIDSGYTGELKIMMTNVANGGHIKAGDKIVSMIPIAPLTGTIQEVRELMKSNRGDKGFGSSGR